MKILIIQTAFIGDVILATSVLEKLHDHFPQASFYFLLRKGNESLLAGHPFLEEVWVFDKTKNKISNLFSLLKKVRAASFDKVINLHRHASTGLLTAFSKADEKIGFDKNPFSFLFTHTAHHEIDDFNNPQHEVDRNHSLISHFTDEKVARPKLYPLQQDVEKAVMDKAYVCMAPASIWFTKRFPKKKWVELINRVDKNVTVCLIGGKDDVVLCEEIKSLSTHPDIKNFAGKLNLLASAALMKNAKMNVVNDSAPMHLASAMNAPVTAIFCSTIPQFGFDPLSDISFVVETEHKLDCRPCGLHGKKACPEGHFRCADIDVGRIRV